MATPSHAQSVKSFNKSSSRKRFTFRSFSQRLEDIEINVYRSLEKFKTEPSEGSSFFRDCLIEWRELNTAEDFISFYEEMIPLTQTLPLVLLHREAIFSKLLCRLNIKARLSLDPILRLIPALSRDLLDDFLPLLPRLVHSLVSLLEDGANRDPEIIEQIFKSWSYLMMYLQKYLVRNIVYVFKATKNLRYYPKDYVQEFMAEGMSFLLRNAPNEEVKKGIRKAMVEVMKNPSSSRKLGVTALVVYVLRGSSSRFHSKAERVLKLLTSNGVYCIDDKLELDSDSALEVVTDIFRRLCEEMEVKELSLMWNCLHEGVSYCIDTANIGHLRYLLSVFVSTAEVNNGRKILDHQHMLELVEILIERYIMKPEDKPPEIVGLILKLTLAVLDAIYYADMASSISDCALKWSPLFELPSTSLMPFIQELLQKDPSVLYAFRVNVIRAMADLVETAEEVVINALLSFSKKVDLTSQKADMVDRAFTEGLLRIYTYLQRTICNWIGKINDMANGNPSSEIQESQLALLWGTVSCYPLMSVGEVNPSSLLDLVSAIDHLLTVSDGHVAGTSTKNWETIIGAALSSSNKLPSDHRTVYDQTESFMELAKKYNSSSRVLFAVADYLESLYGSAAVDSCHGGCHSELDADKGMDAMSIFIDNLHHSEKEIRVATLRILCYQQNPSVNDITKDQPVQKKMKTEESQSFYVGLDTSALQLLLFVENSPLTISTSRKIVLLISRLQTSISSGNIPENYIPLVLNGLIGIMNNRFSHLWSPTLECLAVLISRHVTLVWDKFICCLEMYQSMIKISEDLHEVADSQKSENDDGLVYRFKSFTSAVSDYTPHSTMVSMLLQCLQKVPEVIEPRSRQFVPLFLKLLGYDTDDLVSVAIFNTNVCKTIEWKSVLKEWLNLLKLMRNSKELYRSQFVKEVLQNRLLDENDPEIQMMVLDCLLTWKDEYLLPYEHHLKNLINSKKLREELTTWSLSRESNLVEECHRVYIVPIVIRILIAKVRKLKGLASRKNTSIHHRKAILTFISQLDIKELQLFFALLIKPLQIVPNRVNQAANLFWSSNEVSVNDIQLLNFLELFTMENINDLSLKKKYGLLHVIEEILGVFDEFRGKPFLNFLMGCVVRILRSCSLSLDAAKCYSPDLRDESNGTENQLLTIASIKQLKDVRSLCLRIMSLALNRYEDHEFGSDFWNLFFTSVKTLINGFKLESSSSEKPSSLLSCFVAMSKNYRLVLLLREENLIPDIFSILSAASASEAVKLCVLKFVENLLSLNNELHDEGIERVLRQNIEALISCLRCLFESDSAIKRKLVKCPGETVTRIFNLLPNYIYEPLLAKQFVNILLLFMDNGSQSPDTSVEILHVVRGVVPVLGTKSTSEILNIVSPLIISGKLDMRLCICDLLDALAESDPSVQPVAKVFRELNSTSNNEMGELDYDAIVSAYERINGNFFSELYVVHALLVLSHCVHDMSSEELILRHCAYGALLSFIDFSSVIFTHEDKHHKDMPKTGRNSDWTKSSIQRLTSKFILKHMGIAMSRVVAGRKEWINLLHKMVLKLPEVANLRSLMNLCSDDAEVDFFNNIIHLQKHRRVRALSRFVNVVNTNDMSEDILKKVFVPLFFDMLFDSREATAENIKNACIAALASIAGQLEWKSYYALLNRCFREMRKAPEKNKALLRLICSILDKFHFSESCPGDTLGGTNVLPMTTVSNTLMMASEIEICLQKTVLPEIQKLLNFDSDKVNVNISLAVLKVLKLLPGDVLDLHLSNIVHRISNFLKSRQESTRDEARNALVACLKELGLEFFQFVIKTLRATLKRGYELHVLGYTLHFLLMKCFSSDSDRKLNYCLEDLLSVVENDILGDVAEEKEVEKIASKMKETRKKMSFETLKLIAENISFKTHAVNLLAPVTSHLQKHLAPNVKIKLGNMLHHIAAGIECNPTANQNDLFIFTYGLVEDGMRDEIPQEGMFGTMANRNPSLKIDSMKQFHSASISGAGSLHSHLVIVFALRLFYKRMKSVKMGKIDEQILSMLDPFIALLCRCLSSKDEDVLRESLQCLALLVRLPLPSLEVQADRVKALVLDITQRSLDADSPLTQSSLRLLTLLLRGTKITLSTEQLHTVVQLPVFLELERNPSPVALSLLKGIVNRKLVVPEIYDLATRVGEMMVTSQLESVRQKCSKILLQFLLDYRLSKKRLQQHLGFLLSNLRYEHSTGREAVLEMLHSVIVKFPKSVVDEQSQVFFMHLVCCLENDDDNNVRSMAGAAIKKLIGYTSPNSLQSIIEYCMSWYVSEKQQLWAAAAQVLGLAVEVMKRGFQRHITRVIPIARHILCSAISAIEDTQSDFSAETSIPLWKEAYYTLVMLEKIFNQFHDLLFTIDIQDIWEAICDLLVHPHIWLRCRSSRLLALYFSCVTEASKEYPEKPMLNFSLISPSKLFLVAASFCHQLKTQLMDDTFNNVMTQNLCFAICGVHSLMVKIVDPFKFWSNLGQHEESQFLKAFHLLDSQKGKHTFLSLTSGVSALKEAGDSSDIRYKLVALLLKRMGKIALEMEEIQMQIVFNCFQNIISQINRDDCQHYTSHFLLPLYKVCEGFSGKVISDKMKQLAQDTCDQLRNIMGIPNFVQVYGQIRKNLKAKRDKRRQEEKLMAVVDPTRNAKRKLRIAAKHRANKKRKIMTMKMTRWMR